MKWKKQNTRCYHIKKDGIQCKMEAPKGEYLCEHHQYDLRAYMKHPIETAKKFKKYWGKAHHPACDKKGSLVCDCPDIRDGAILALALKRGNEKSLSTTPTKRRLNHLDMLLKLRRIKAYYNSITVDDLWLPPEAKWRQFRLFVYDRRAKLVRVQKIRDTINTKEKLLKHLRKHTPLHVYYSTSKWMRSQSVGPDPHSKGGRRKFKKQGRNKWLDNLWLGQGFYVDVDYEMKDTTMAAEMTAKVIAWYRENVDRFSNLTIVSSGGKGFHVINYNFVHEVHLNGELLKGWQGAYDKTYAEKGMTPMAIRQNISRNLKRLFVDKMKRDGLLVDYEVTPDPRRIIRLPGTIHGKHMTVCKIISEDDLFDWENQEIA
jgi:hypothetical protein